jgi:hypothetical protein
MDSMPARRTITAQQRRNGQDDVSMRQCIDVVDFDFLARHDNVWQRRFFVVAAGEELPQCHS